MKQTNLTRAIDQVVKLKMQAIDDVIEELVEPLAIVGSPEKLIGKPYESWTPQDLMALTGIYGTKEPNPLSDLVFKKTYERVKTLEGEELQW